MKSEPDQTTARPTDDDNVVPLPRDWLGPRDELVPVGNTSRADSADNPPPTAQDFWTEDSWALQDPWQAPAAREVAAAAAQPQHERRGGRVATFVSRVREPAMRARLIAVAAISAVLAAAVLAVGHPGGGSPAARASADSNSKPAADTKLSAGQGHTTHVVTHRQPRVRHPRVVATRPNAKRSKRHVTHRAGTSSSDAPTSTGASAAETTSGTEAQQTTPVVANPTPQHQDSMVSASDSSTGHPTGAGAAIAPGYIP